MRSLACGLIVIFSALIPLSVAVADTYYIVPDVSGDDYPAIQGAIDAASDGDTVLVMPGTYVENIDFGGKDIVLQSIDGANVTAIDGGGVSSVVYFHNGEQVTAEDFVYSWNLWHCWIALLCIFCDDGCHTLLA